MIHLDKEEKLIAKFRKHPFYIAIKIIGLVILAILGFAVLFPILESLFRGLAGDTTYLVYFFYFMYLSILWVLGFIFWTEYYLDMWILTDKRLIDVEQRGLFSREVSSLRLDKIQDVKVEVVGVIDTFLHIGTIHVQTAGSEKEFVIPSAKSPEVVKRQILDAHNTNLDTVKTVRIAN